MQAKFSSNISTVFLFALWIFVCVVDIYLRCAFLFASCFPCVCLALQDLFTVYFFKRFLFCSAMCPFFFCFSFVCVFFFVCVWSLGYFSHLLQ